MLEIIQDAIIDSLKLLPFLFITYLIMEYIEHKTSKKARETIKKSGKFGPLIGSVLGIFPQCGFSVSATNLYAARVITLGTLIAVYLSTSDEMLPIFISESVPVSMIIIVLAIKLSIGICAGFAIDLVIKNIKKKRVQNKAGKKAEEGENEEDEIMEFCQKEHCHCDHDGIIKSSIKHTVSIFIYILLITIIFNIIIYFIGEDAIKNFIQAQPILGPVLAGIIGLIPNCASSVIITEMFLENILTFSGLISGLLVNAGVGLAVLFKTNKGIKSNLKIVVLLYGIGVLSGALIEIIQIIFNYV